MSPARRADSMPSASTGPRWAGGVVPLALLLLAACPCAHAERADRSKPISVESDGEQPGLFDLNKHTAVLTGRVAITQGTLEIHAARVEIAEDRTGPKLAVAYGAPGAPARFRQKGDRPDEWNEGDASRIEYDGAAGRVRFIGDAHLRILHGTTVTNSASAAVVTYDVDAGLVSTGAGRTTLQIAPWSSPDAPHGEGRDGVSLSGPMR